MHKNTDSKAITGPLLLLRGLAAKKLAPDHNEKFLLSIGASLKTLRKARGLSLAALSVKSGVPRQILTTMEEGRADVGLSVFAAVEASLGCAPGFVLRASDWRITA